MGNYVSYDRRPDIPVMMMSNGQTSVFISVLVLAASALAREDRERDLAIWLATHDQAIYGSGTVGFDISEIPWSEESFADTRDFLLRVSDAAKAGTGWDLLEYAPDEDRLKGLVDGFRHMIEAVEADHVVSVGTPDPSVRGTPVARSLCPRHRVYLHADGCVICNDA